MYRFPIKDPDEVLDYIVDFTDEWGSPSNDSTATCSVNILTSSTPPLVVTEAGVRDQYFAYFWLSGGLANTDYSLDITITTELGRVYHGVFAIKVENKQVKNG